ACATANHDSLFRINCTASNWPASSSKLGSRRDARPDEQDPVVLVSELPSLLELRRCLAEAARDDPGQPPHARAFAAWVQHEASLLRVLADEAVGVRGPARHTVHAAVLGYAAHIDPAFIGPFVEALDWLRQREYFAPGRPLIFEVDGLGLLGTALGII